MKTTLYIWVLALVAAVLFSLGCKDNISSNQRKVSITVLEWAPEGNHLGEVRVECSDAWKLRGELGVVAIQFAWSAKIDLIQKHSGRKDGAIFVGIDKEGQTVMCAATAIREFTVHIQVPGGRFEEFHFTPEDAGLQVFSKRIEDFSVNE